MRLPWVLWLYQTSFAPALLLVAFIAWWRGQWPERAAAALFVAAWIATKLLKPDALHRFHNVEIGLTIMDVTLLAGAAYLAIRSGRGWLIWFTALQLISTCAHLARALDGSLTPLAYSIMEQVSSTPAVILLAWGTWRHPRVRKDRPAVES